MLNWPDTLPFPVSTSPWRGRIPRFLPDAEARSLADALMSELSWDWVFQDPAGEVVTLPASRWQSLARRQIDQLRDQIHQRARSHFQFSFRKFSIVDALRNGVALPGSLAVWIEAFASKASIERVRALTGFADIQRVDAQVTLYLPGDFLTLHTDDHDARYPRRVAYVYNLCPVWQTDWGGLLMFMGDEGRAEETWAPEWNTLNLFSVPQPHSVSMVAPFAGGPRLSITGWFTA